MLYLKGDGGKKEMFDFFVKQVLYYPIQLLCDSLIQKKTSFHLQRISARMTENFSIAKLFNIFDIDAILFDLMPTTACWSDYPSIRASPLQLHRANCISKESLWGSQSYTSKCVSRCRSTKCDVHCGDKRGQSDDIGWNKVRVDKFAVGKSAISATF